ncbi:MAG: LpxI family protein, partial [Candidatus Omnitrophica bacterium]|nr:LpxI family protein [Candidatus Omnitrophota bacterium]
PFQIAREAKRLGRRVVAIGIQGWADGALAAEVDSYEELPVGQLGRLIARLKAWGVRQAVMAGKVTKVVLVGPGGEFDPEMAGLLARVKDRSVNGVLGAVASRLAQDGIELVDSAQLLSAQLCPPGVLTRRSPTPQQLEDIRLGFDVARQLAALDVGQTVVVKDKVIVAVEALEGTDAAIRRAHELVGPGLVVVKAASPSQDRRFDLPVVGPDTIRLLGACGVACLAVQAGLTLLLDRAAVLAGADDAKLCLVGA